MERLNKALSTYEVAEHIYNVDNGKTLSEALSLLEKANAENDENVNDDDADPLSLKQALKHRKAPTGAKSPIANKTIVMGKNKTKVNLNDVDKKNATKSFDAASARVSSTQKGMSEDQITDHRTADGELPWKKRNVTASMMVTVKKAALASHAARQENFEGHFKLNETATNILKAKAALNEDAGGRLRNDTPAARTIVPNALPKEPSVEDRLPPAWRKGGLLPVQKERDVASMLVGTPFAVSPKATDFMDASGRMKSPTKAGRTLDKGKPDFSKSNPEQTDQGEIARKYYGNNDVPKPASTTNSGPDSYKEAQKRKSREGQWPADPANPNVGEPSASSPTSRW